MYCMGIEKTKHKNIMKRSILFGIVALALIVGACEGRKAAQESEVRDYGKYFIEKLAANQIDSIKDTYPDIVKSVSLVPVKSDTVIVVESEPGKFDVTLAEGITLKVNRSEEGQITVAESKGLFAFPEDKVKLAKKTGMWDDSLSDAQLAERMNDKDFFNWVKKNKTVNKNKLISFTDFKESPGQDPMGNYARDGYHYLTNNTDVEINGNDYSMIYEDGEFWGDTGERSSKKTKAGKTIPPHGKVKVMATAGYHSWSYLKSIKWKLSQEQLQEKFAPYTGKEYQEYLDSKKK